jgi:outer membrane protein OmpA-like peptidoglycan-associated protein
MKFPRGNLSKRITFLFIAFLTLLASCTPTSVLLNELATYERSLKTRGNYESFLALEYLVFARNLASIEDFDTSEYFAQKGLDLRNNRDVVPENPIKWEADPQQMEEMVLMQKRLELVLLVPHMKFHLPIQLAHLTYLYDCWITRESKAVFRADELAKCRTRFYKLMDEVEYYIDDLRRDKNPKVEISAPEFEKFEIFFDLNSVKFNDKANKEMLDVLKYIGSLMGDYRILVIGNADRTGLKLYNQALAFKRAEVTRNYLIKSGIHADFVTARSAGESFPDIVTLDGVQKQLNRSVGIYILKGFGSFTSYPLPLVENIIYRNEIRKARETRGLTN